MNKMKDKTAKKTRGEEHWQKIEAMVRAWGTETANQEDAKIIEVLTLAGWDCEALLRKGVKHPVWSRLKARRFRALVTIYRERGTGKIVTIEAYRPTTFERLLWGLKKQREGETS